MNVIDNYIEANAKIKEYKELYYDGQEILSYKCILNILIGLRGGGKTYWWKRFVIKRFLRNEEQFVWVRRYQTQLDETKTTFFNAIQSDLELKKEFGDIKFEVKGNDIYINDGIAGTFVSLSTSSKFKGSDYPFTAWIIFDEFIEVEGTKFYYLKNEVRILYDLMETVGRLRDDYRCILIGNALSFNNPYFIEYRVKPFNNGFKHIIDKSIVVQMYINQQFIDKKVKTRFGRLTAETDYAYYAIHNNFLDVNDIFIDKKSKNSRFLCSLKYEGNVFGFWIDESEGMCYATTLVDGNSKINYTLSTKDHDINYMLIKNINGTYLSSIVESYRMGVLRFQDQRTKAIMLEVMLLFNR